MSIIKILYWVSVILSLIIYYFSGVLKDFIDDIKKVFKKEYIYLDDIGEIIVTIFLLLIVIFMPIFNIVSAVDSIPNFKIKNPFYRGKKNA